MPFKDRIRQQWELWMIAEGLIHGSTSPPSREDICRWTLEAYQSLPEQLILNSWLHGDYRWFPTDNAAPHEEPQPVLN